RRPPARPARAAPGAEGCAGARKAKAAAPLLPARGRSPATRAAPRARASCGSSPHLTAEQLLGDLTREHGRARRDVLAELLGLGRHPRLGFSHHLFGFRADLFGQGALEPRAFGAKPLALGAGLATHPIHFALERIELSLGLSFELARLFAGTVDRALTLVEERDG